MVDVTVLLPVYNGGKFLEEAIQSILNQAYTNFELLIINDGSTDNSAQIIDTFQDGRINFVNNTNNQGLVKTLNFGVKKAKGSLIARMDADDVADKYRLGKQVKFLTENKDIDVVGCQINFIDEFSQVTGQQIYPPDHESIKIDSLFRCPLPHSGVVFKKEKFIANNLFYNASYKYTEDYELWQRALSILKFANHSEKLLNYRITPYQVSTVNLQAQKKESIDIRLNYLRALGLQDQQENTQHLFLNFLDYELQLTEKLDFETLLNIIDKAVTINKQRKIFSEVLFNKMLFTRLDWLVKIYTTKKNKLYSIYQTHQLFNFSTLRLIDKFKIACKEWMP